MKASHPLRTSARRQFLRGAGGVILGLPWLPSLVSKQAAAATGAKRFVAFTSEHGAANGASFCPPASATPERQEIFPGYEIKFGTLAGQIMGDRRVLSPVLTAKSNVLTPALLKKMNVLRGFDIDFYIGHHWGGHLGNFAARVDANSQRPMPTIDQVMAYSPKFYPSLSGIRQRSMVTGQSFRGVSWGHSNPTAGTGPIQALNTQTSSRQLFDTVMMGVTQPTTMPAEKRKPIVDRVLDGYKQLRESNRRLSSEDRRRIDDHMARLSELERRLSLTSNVTCSASKPNADSRSLTNDLRRTDPQFFSLVNDVIAMAFACDTSRIATVCVISTFMMDYSGNWHQDVAHNAMQPGPQSLLVDSHQRTFEATIVDLAAKLDQIEDGPGQTVLDNTLVQWTQESGPSTHDAQAMPIITFGGAGGYFKTGHYVDYRYQVPTAGQSGDYMGLPFRRWLGNALMAMGLARGDFETNGVPGYGDPHSQSGVANKAHKDSRGSSISERLPIITG